MSVLHNYQINSLRMAQWSHEDQVVGVVHPGDGVGLGTEVSVIAHIHLFLLPQNYEKKGLVPKKRSSNISHFCKQLHFSHLKPSKETLLTFILMATRFFAAL